MHVFICFFLGLQAELESEYQLWLASRRVCWDIFHFFVTICYVIAYFREICPRLSHSCGYSSLFLCALGMVGIGLLAFNRSYYKMRQYIFAGV